MTVTRALGVSLVAIASAIMAPMPRSATAMAQSEPEMFTALAVNMGNVGPTQPLVVDITIRRWLPEEERARLITTLVEKGADALLEALRDTKPVGTIRTPDSIGYDLRYAYQEPAKEGGRRIVVITDRPIEFWEARSQPRTIEYPFTVIEMHILPNGKGEGKMSIATKVIPVGKTIYLEDYSTQPVRLQNVRAKRLKP